MHYKNILLGSVERFNVIIETPKGSENNYEYDEKLDAIKLKWVFKNGFCFPFDYGFIPQTLAEDKDVADAFVITSYPLYPGTIAECKTIGIIEVLDRGEVDDKIIAVPVVDPEYNAYVSLQELQFGYKAIFEDFFRELAIQKNKKVEVKGFHDALIARKYIEETHKIFTQQNIEPTNYAHIPRRF
ncbi:MAG: hypothetical protein A3C82_01360 [Candidatus Wildermuthbacteria bacterium RIFCSPHIGHO2_02_FULL_47_12]|uniref:inorganic diphosphatase n=2 Tax=Parcubacteria group TaxID=1794811 RepID=A0A1G2R3W0_9BACT|nr:MAG: hypothetical protein A3A24_03500 [Candidatus Buchananbacteria bacterium RIFCSPLOWO2_01_FULL_46_12]OHA66751.1 MAG: hypothetical protein A3C82_01360 [Candidatus Wildermuthbacteria bacterium RIFCSPHIGHO2_02_FULL_47_12]